MSYTTGFDKEKILAKLKRGTNYINDCWLFKGGSVTKDGYHKLVIHKRRYNITRLSLFIFFDYDLSYSNPLQANHKLICPNKNCWNPKHLYAGTHAQNMTDQPLKGEHYWTKKSHCPLGHELDGTYYSRIKGKTYRYCKTCARIRMQVKREKSE